MTECAREQDVLDALLSEHWPADLRRHIDECRCCESLALVAAAFQNERDAALGEARLPTSGQVWWRATMRTRAEAVRAASRPITVLQGLAAACAIGLFAPLLLRSWASLGQPLSSIAVAFPPVAVPQALVVALVGAAIILAPFILYLVLSD